MGRLPTTADFPSKLELNIVPPPSNDPPTNILLLLHGLGDNHQSFTTLAQQLNLPETACISLRGPQNLLDLGGFHWGDDIMFDSNSGGLDMDAGFVLSTEVLKSVVIGEVLVGKCGFALREVMVFGFGQGGMAALALGVALHQSPLKSPTSPTISTTELAGIISIGAPLPSSSSSSHSSTSTTKSPTPILICAGNDNSSLTPSAEIKLHQFFDHVEIKRYRRSGDAMPGNRDEMLPIMQFFSRRLRSGKGVPEGAVEVGLGS